MHFTCPENLFASAFSPKKLSSWIDIFSIAGSTAVLENSEFSISKRDSLVPSVQSQFHLSAIGRPSRSHSKCLKLHGKIIS